jgi:hypothetical protein
VSDAPAHSSGQDTASGLIAQSFGTLEKKSVLFERASLPPSPRRGGHEPALPVQQVEDPTRGGLKHDRAQMDQPD